MTPSHSDDANTSSPQRLPKHLADQILPAPAWTYRDELDEIVINFRVEALALRREFQNEFYELAKSIGRLASVRKQFRAN